jgi:hypothetical protein
VDRLWLRVLEVGVDRIAMFRNLLFTYFFFLGAREGKVTHLI